MLAWLFSLPVSEFGVIAEATEEEKLKWFRREQVFCDGGRRRSQS